MILQLKAEIFNLDMECNKIIHSKHQDRIHGRHYYYMALFKVSGRGQFHRFETDIPHMTTCGQPMLYQNGNLAYVLYKFSSHDLQSFEVLINQLERYNMPSLKLVSHQNYRLDLRDFDLEPDFLQGMLYNHFHFEVIQS